MKNLKPYPSVSDLLERSKLSKLPSLSRAKPFAVAPVTFTPPAFAPPVVHVICQGCGGRTDHTNEFQRAVGVCRSCLIVHSKVDEAFLTYAKRKAHDQLGKFSGGDDF